LSGNGWASREPKTLADKTRRIRGMHIRLEFRTAAKSASCAAIAIRHRSWSSSPVWHTVNQRQAVQAPVELPAPGKHARTRNLPNTHANGCVPTRRTLELAVQLVAVLPEHHVGSMLHLANSGYGNVPFLSHPQYRHTRTQHTHKKPTQVRGEPWLEHHGEHTHSGHPTALSPVAVPKTTLVLSITAARWCDRRVTNEMGE